MAAALGNNPSESWLEPSVGTGALLSALRVQGVSPKQITGIDLDPSGQALDALAGVKRGVEFVSWSQRTTQRFDKIICNPPYVAIEKLQQSIRKAVSRVTTLGDVHVSGTGNLWYAFLCASISLLKDQGSLCFVLPAAWDFANYARALRTKIATAFERVEVYRCAKPLFHAENIQDGVVILVARRKHAQDKRPRPGVGLVRRDFSTSDDLIRALRATGHRQAVAATPVEETVKTSFQIKPVVKLVRLGDILTIQLGGVTGDVSYFLLTESERLSWGLPIAALRPVVSRAKHLQSAKLSRIEWDKLLQSGARVWLFNPPPSVMEHPAVRTYIDVGEHGACNLKSHKISKRAPWFRTPLPSRIDCFLSGMSQIGPWLCFRAMPRLSATNTLYVATFNSGFEHYKAAVALSLFSSRVRDQLPRLGRRYADGLVKFEPGDLREIQVELPSSIRPAIGAYRDAVSKMMSGQMRLSTEVADRYYSGGSDLTIRYAEVA